MKLKEIAARFKGPILIIFVVLVANFLYLSGAFKSNPTLQYAGVASFTHVGILNGQPTIDPNNAFTTQALGHTAARDILHGKLPWWSYDEQAGAPLAGEMQSASLFLPFNLLLALAGGVLFFHITLQFIAGIATYYLLKKLHFKEPIAITGAALFALNGTFAWLTNAAFNPIAFLPVMLLGVEILFQNYKKRKHMGIILIAIGLAYSLYAGFPEVAFLDCFLVGVWSLARIFQIRNDDWQKFTLKIVVGLICGLAIAAPILIAFKDYLPYADVGIHSGPVTNYSLPFKSLPALLFPYSYGPIFSLNGFDPSGVLSNFWDNVGGYLSLSIVFLAIIGVIKERRNRILVYFLSGWSVIVGARIYGFPGLSRVISIIPGMSSVAFYRYSQPSLELAVIVLAMFGLNEIITRKVERKLIVKVSLAMAAIVVCLMLIAFKEEHKLYLAPHHHLWLAASVFWGIACLLAIILTITTKLKKWAKVLIPVILLVDAIAMFIIPQLSAPRHVTVDTKPIMFLQKNLGNQRFFGLGTILPNYGSYYNTASVNTNDLPIAKQWSKYVLSSLDPNTDTISGFTGQNQATPTGISPEQAFFMYFKGYEQVGVKYVVIHPNVFTASEIETYKLKLVFSDSLYQIYQLPNPTPYFNVGSGACSLQPLGLNKVKANCQSSSTLDRDELNMEGWHATVNGKSVAVQTSKPIFQKVDLPKGKSIVVFMYQPKHIKIAEAAAIIGILALVSLALDQKYHLLNKLK
jgi:hypothetical protein